MFMTIYLCYISFAKAHSSSRTEQFDNFLMTLLYYFEAYFERHHLENKPRPMATYVFLCRYFISVYDWCVYIQQCRNAYSENSQKQSTFASYNKVIAIYHHLIILANTHGSAARLTDGKVY